MSARLVRVCTPAPISGRLVKPPITTHDEESSRQLRWPETSLGDSILHRVARTLPRFEGCSRLVILGEHDLRELYQAAAARLAPSLRLWRFVRL